MKKVLFGLAVMALCATSIRAETIWRWCDYSSSIGAYGFYNDSAAVVKLGVWPVASGHSTGAVYTPDGWSTVKWATGSWCWNENNQYGGQDENWRINWTHQGGFPTFNYAIYVDTSGGTRYWDNNGGWNYSLSTAMNNLRAEYIWSCQPQFCD